jgi:hypothetical protein
LRLVGEQRKRAREHIVDKLAGSLSPGMVKALDGLLEVKEGKAASGLQAIKANPAKPSATAMQGLADKLAAIEATGVLAVDLSWLNANYQRALFHYVRKCSADRLREVARPRSRPDRSVLVPPVLSVSIFSHPAAFRASSWRSRF